MTWKRRAMPGRSSVVTNLGWQPFAVAPTKVGVDQSTSCAGPCAADPANTSMPVRHFAVEPVFLLQSAIVVGRRNTYLHAALLNAFGQDELPLVGKAA